MIQAVQKTDSVACKPKSNFKATNAVKSAFSDNQLKAAEYKYNLACLWAATYQLENAKLKQELANASAQVSYCKACGK